MTDEKALREALSWMLNQAEVGLDGNSWEIKNALENCRCKLTALLAHVTPKGETFIGFGTKYGNCGSCTDLRKCHPKEDWCEGYKPIEAPKDESAEEGG